MYPILRSTRVWLLRPVINRCTCSTSPSTSTSASDNSTVDSTNKNRNIFSQKVIRVNVLSSSNTRENFKSTRPSSESATQTTTNYDTRERQPISRSVDSVELTDGQSVSKSVNTLCQSSTESASHSSVAESRAVGDFPSRDRTRHSNQQQQQQGQQQQQQQHELQQQHHVQQQHQLQQQQRHVQQQQHPCESPEDSSSLKLHGTVDSSSHSKPGSESEVIEIVPSPKHLSRLRWKHAYPMHQSGFSLFAMDEKKRRQDTVEFAKTTESFLYRIWAEELTEEERQDYRDSAARIMRARLEQWAIKMRSEGNDEVARLLLKHCRGTPKVRTWQKAKWQGRERKDGYSIQRNRTQ